MGKDNGTFRTALIASQTQIEVVLSLEMVNLRRGNAQGTSFAWRGIGIKITLLSEDATIRVIKRTCKDFSKSGDIFQALGKTAGIDHFRGCYLLHKIRR